MHNELRTFFDHSRHKLWVRRVDARLDVLAFEGEERLSQPFNYCVEFTSGDGDIAAERLLGQDASFSLHGAPQKLPFLGLSVPEVKPLRMARLYAGDTHGLPLIPGTEVAEKAQAAAKNFARREAQA